MSSGPHWADGEHAGPGYGAGVATGAAAEFAWRQAEANNNLTGLSFYFTIFN